MEHDLRTADHDFTPETYTRGEFQFTGNLESSAGRLAQVVGRFSGFWCRWLVLSMMVLVVVVLLVVALFDAVVFCCSLSNCYA